jgi:magnesium-transporting ATPase (P-type)
VITLGPSPEPNILVRLAGLAPEAALAELRTSLEGLSPDDAAARLARVGANELPKPHGPGLIRQLLDQLFHLFALILWIAAGLAFVGAMPQLGVAIIVVILVNGAFSFAQEYRAERAVRALSALLPETALVRRGGRKQRAPAGELVPGDIVLLREGDRISADARVVESQGLKVDMSTLTGESAPVERVTDALAEAFSDPLEAANLVFAGTFVTSGWGTVAVAATGGATRLGSISRLTGEVIRRPTPLRLQLNRAVRVLAAFAVGTGLAFLAIALGLGTPPRDGFLFSVGVIVALVPEGLLPTLSLSLAMSATRMARRGALVRRLESVETLGSTSVICTDKTGTITTNQMTVKAVVLPHGRYTTTGSGYDPGGTILSGDGRPLTEDEWTDVRRLLHAAALCGDARVEQRDGRWGCVGDPTEGALLVLAKKGGVEREDQERIASRVREFPFESQRRRMSTVHMLSSGGCEVLAKGSPEAILPLCKSIRVDAVAPPLGQDEEREVLAAVDSLAGKGLRVLAFARREIEGGVPQTAVQAETEMEFLGLVGMADPVRPEVPEAVARCRQAGMRVVMITGDHPGTAMTVAREAGLAAHTVMLGSELPESDDALGNLLATHDVVLARIAPEEKLRIARALQGRGEVVAMTGDGVNDAPALRQADIGIAMGKFGTDVAREAADLVLLDDNFAHIVQAVEEGRAAFDNIKRFLTYHLTDNVAELAPFVVWALSAGRIPLMISVLQVLALDIGTDLLPALALGAERPEPGVMDRPPRPRTVRLLDRSVLGRAFGFLGPVEAVVAMAMLPLGAALFFGWPARPLPASGAGLATLSTMVFAAIVAMQMANAFECRSNPASLFSIGPLSNRLLVGAVAVEALALVAFVYLPPIRDALGQRPLRPAEWLPVLIAPWILLAAEEARKVAVQRTGPPRPPDTWRRRPLVDHFARLGCPDGASIPDHRMDPGPGGRRALRCSLAVRVRDDSRSRVEHVDCRPGRCVARRMGHLRHAEAAHRSRGEGDPLPESRLIGGRRCEGAPIRERLRFPGCCALPGSGIQAPAYVESWLITLWLVARVVAFAGSIVGGRSESQDSLGCWRPRFRPDQSGLQAVVGMGGPLGYRSHDPASARR